MLYIMLSETDLMTRTAVETDRRYVFTYAEIQPAFRFSVLTTRSTTADFRQQ